MNASASSTSDYTSSGSGKLDLDGSSRLQQTIGTATSAFNTSTNARAATEVAHTRATEVVTAAATAPPTQLITTGLTVKTVGNSVLSGKLPTRLTEMLVNGVQSESIREAVLQMCRAQPTWNTNLNPNTKPVPNDHGSVVGIRIQQGLHQFLFDFCRNS